MTPASLKKLPKLALLFVLGAAATAQAELRTFTSPDGRALQGDIQSATADSVTLKLANGQPLTAPVSKFSDVDKAYIAEWRKANPATTKYDFAASYSKEKVSSSKQKTGAVEQTVENWICNLKITNRSGQLLENLKVNYEVLCERASDGATGPRKVTGSVEIPSIKHLEETKLPTGQITLAESKLRAGFYYKDGTRPRNKDSIESVGIKIVHNQQVVFEWSSDGAASDKGALSR